MIARLKTTFMGSAARKGASTIVLTSIIAQVIVLVALPLLGRMYSPADFGILTVITAMGGLLGSWCAFRFDLAVPIPVSDADAWALHRLACIASSLVCGLALSICIVWPRFVAGFASDSLLHWIWVVPMLGFVSSMLQLQNQTALRFRLYSSTARQNVFRSVFTVAPQVALSFLGGGLGLVVGAIVGPTVALSYLRARLRTLRAAVDRAACGRVLRQYWRFPVLLTPAALLNAAGVQLPILLLADAFGPDVAGYIGVAQRLLLVPMTVLGQAIAQVYVGEFARAERLKTRGLTRIFTRATTRLAVVAGICISTAVLCSPFIEVILGIQWAPAVGYFQVLAVAAAAQLVVYPVSQTLVILRRPASQFLWDLGRLAVVVGAVLCAIARDLSPIDATIVFSSSSAAMYGVLWAVSWWVVRRYDRLVTQS